jgi:apolipoprotein N-acyltransferase
LSKKIYIEFLFLIFLGALTLISLPPFNFFIINFLSFSLFFLFLIKKSYQHKDIKLFFFYGWFFGFGYFLTNLYWISISLTFDQNLKFLIPITTLIIPSFLAIFYGLISFLFIIFKSKKIISSFLIFSLIFSLLEFVRGNILTGFPWNLIVYSFSNKLEILSIISIIGTYGLNLLCISFFTSPALILIKKTKKNISLFAFFLITFILFYFHGLLYEKKFNNAEKEFLEYKVRVVGSNIEIDRFYSNKDPVSIIKDLIKISNPDKNQKTIFVWPEAILSDIFQNELTNYNWLFESFNKNHFLIIGNNSQSINGDTKNFYNSFSVYNNKLELIESYDKINLVPFGEFLPFEKKLNKIGLKSLTNNYQSFSKGNERNIIEIKKENFSLKILPLICYEIIYSGKLFDNSDFDLIINISEDGWFGNSIGPNQHFDHSILRAIESGKYVLRSSNNGIAAIINPIGTIEKKVNLGQSGYIDLKQNKIIQPTIFSQYGNKIFGLLILLYIFLIFSFNKIKDE